MFAKLRSLFSKRLDTPFAIQAEIARLAAKREKAWDKAFKSPLMGSLIFDPCAKPRAIDRRIKELRGQLLHVVKAPQPVESPGRVPN